MDGLIDALRPFNRKERFFVVTAAAGADRLELAPSFREELGRELGVEVPAEAYAAIDYHLDWLYAALRVAAGLKPGHPADNSTRVIRGNQEDIDLLVAFDLGGLTHLALLEAKVETGWKNDQLVSKAGRLAAIFGPEGSAHPGVVPHFVLWSPRRPQQLDLGEWPTWMSHQGRPHWMQLKRPEHSLRVGRTDAAGRPGRDGTYFTVRESR